MGKHPKTDGRSRRSTGLVLGLLAAIATLGLQWSPIPVLGLIEGHLYDASVRLADRRPSERIAIIGIDEASIESIGPWPLPRQAHASLIDTLASAKPKVIAYLVPFDAPDRSLALDYVDRLGTEHAHARNEWIVDDTSSSLARMGVILNEAKTKLDVDKVLESSIDRAGNVLLPMSLDDAGTTIRTVPLARFARVVAGVGHLDRRADADGIRRSEPLIRSLGNDQFPSLSLLAAANALGASVRDVLSGRLSTSGSLRPHAYRAAGGASVFPIDSFADVLSGRTSTEKYRDQIVLIGATGGAGLYLPSRDPASAPVFGLADGVSSILERHWITVPEWAAAFGLGVFATLALYLMFVLPRLQQRVGLATSLALLALVVVAEMTGIIVAAAWVPLAHCAVLVGAGQLFWAGHRFIPVHARVPALEAEPAESQWVLAEMYQSQGQLDLALENLLQCTVTEPVLKRLYALALDFERKRRFDRAEVALRHIAEHRREFRDVQARLERASRRAGSLARTGPVAAPSGGVERIEQLKLGRFLVERKLGEGPIGTLYLGRHPEDGRPVAIKAVALAEAFPGELVAEAKRRFFREAEAAGRLDHSDIVTLLDAGSEYDLVYTVMEHAPGVSLEASVDQFESRESRLPIEQAIAIIGRVARALDYAHRRKVVHHDVKPSNIIVDLETGSVKITDFGFGRVGELKALAERSAKWREASAYASPERAAGRRVDARSDLYSLAVVLYRLLSGHAPFELDPDESFEQWLHRLGNDPPPDIRHANPAISAALAMFLQRAMATRPNDRIATGAAFAAELAEAAVRAETEGVLPLTPVPALLEH